MSVWQSTVFVDAPACTVAAALRHTRTAANGLAGLGGHGRPDPRAGVLLVPHDASTFRFLPIGPAVRATVLRADQDVLAESAAAAGFPLWHGRAEVAETNGRTRITLSVHARGLGRCVLRAGAGRRVERAMEAHLAEVGDLARRWADRPIVVGAAITSGDGLLAQQRCYPARDAGKWELPGGRVEPGETESEAVVRECLEELDVEVCPTGRLGTDVPIEPAGMLLRVHIARLTDEAARPRPVEHRALRWIEATEMERLDWLEADRLLVPSLRRTPDSPR